MASFGLEWRHSEALLDPLLEYSLAHILMLARQGVVPEPEAQRILTELSRLRAQGPGAVTLDLARDGFQPCIEAELTHRLGADVAGWLGTGRARQECELVARQMLNHRRLLKVIDASLRLRDALEAQAALHVHTLMPYHTWAQHAEPITLGYYLASVAEALAADGDRLCAAHASLGRSRASCGQVVPPPLPIDREQVARWLGFDSVIENSLYAYASQDSELDALAAVASLMAHLARLSANLYLWASDEFGFLRLSDTLSGTSYAMPQKRNPYALRQVRPLAAGVQAAWMEVAQLHGGAVPLVGDGLVHCGNRLLEWLPRVEQGLDVLSAGISGLEVDADRMAQACTDDWIQASQLAYLLVLRQGMSFREAHALMHHLVRHAQHSGTGPQSLSVQQVQAAAEAAGLSPAARTRAVLAPEVLAQALDPRRQVASRSVGGPAAPSVRDHLRRLATRREHHRAWHAQQLTRGRDARQALRAAVDQVTQDPDAAPRDTEGPI